MRENDKAQIQRQVSADQQQKTYQKFNPVITATSVISQSAIANSNKAIFS